MRDRSRDQLSDLGPIRDHTPAQEERMRELVTDQPDADYLLDVLGIDPTQPRRTQ